MNKIIYLLPLTLVFGCVAPTKKADPQIVALKRQLLELQQEIGRQKEILKDQEHKILLLSENSRRDVEKPNSLTESQAVNQVSEMDIRLANQAQSFLNNKKYPEAERVVELMMKGYKDSPQTTNALFQLGVEFYKDKNFLKAAQYLEILVKEFPDSGRSVGGLYYLGLTYKKLGKVDLASNLLKSVMALYPGSRESQLSKEELAMLERTH